MHARLLHGCMSHSITDDRETSSAERFLAPLLAPLSSRHLSGDSSRECTLTYVILLHGSVSYGMTHDLPRIMRQYRSSKQMCQSLAWSACYTSVSCTYDGMLKPSLAIWHAATCDGTCRHPRAARRP